MKHAYAQPHGVEARIRGRVVLASLMLISWAAGILAAEPRAGERLSFVSCPIVRDTKTVPCWLAEHEGETYFLTLQTDVSAPVNPPWLGHKVLVEGIVSDEPSICGGRVLKPLALSVMQELDGSCNTVLPAEDRYELTFEPPRPPGPSRGRLAFGDPTPRTGTAPDGSAPGDGANARASGRTFTLQYEFDGMVAFRHAQILQQILDLAHKTKALEVQVTGYRSASRLSNGAVMRERDKIDRQRAEQVRELLKGAGLTGVKYTLHWKDLSRRPNGKDDASNRRAEIVVAGAR
jgi:hypothetical protein